jgi:hypothetical protein
MRESGSQSAVVWCGLLIALGIVIASVIFSRAFIEARAGERSVVVKGLAEREVDADLAIWPITFTETGNDLAALQQSIDSKRAMITKFLDTKGFTADEISQSAPRIRDNQAEAFVQKNDTKFRYIAQVTVLVRSTKIHLIKSSMESAGELVAQGIVLASDWQSRTEFLFAGLNLIKPAMIEEATKNARSVAEKFAQDSHSRLGKIRSASQGLFTITDRDLNSPDKKDVRVVTTVEYLLADE